MCAGKFEWPTISASTILQQIAANIVQICTITVRSSSEMSLNGQLSFSADYTYHIILFDTD